MRRSPTRCVAKVGLAGLVHLGMSACSTDEPDRGSSFSDGCVLNSEAVACDDCLQFSHVARLGDVDGTGYLASTTMSAVVRDHRSHYWVGQGDWINIYDPGGAFVTTVGRKGEGPLEFQRAWPFHVDGAGRIHVQDVLNLRVSVINEDGTLYDEKRLPTPRINDLVAVADGERYAIQSWIQTPELLGFPIHVVEDGQIQASFGLDSAVGREMEDLTTGRHLAIDVHGNVFVAHHYDYFIEVWSHHGSRLGRLEGLPALDDGLRTGTRQYNWDNPPWHFIQDIHVDADGLLWVLLSYRRPDWRDNMVELALPDGTLSLVPVDMDPTRLMRSRIDVVDLNTCAMIASQWRDELLIGFLEDGTISGGEVSQVGVPFINIWKVDLSDDSTAGFHPADVMDQDRDPAHLVMHRR